MKERLRAGAGPALGLALLAAAGAILYRELAPGHVQEIWAGLHSIGGRAFAGALVLAALGYVALAACEVLAFRFAGRRLGTARIALVSFIASAFSHALGFSFLGGGAVRYRMLRSFGVTTEQLARVMGFNFVTFWLGLLALGALALMREPAPWPGSRVLGAVLAAALAAYVV